MVILFSEYEDNEHSDNFFAMFDGESRTVDYEEECRDGLYNDDDMYYVFGRSEVKQLIDVITNAYNSI